ncbi:FeoC-like transcriptional regulator [Thiomicrorhabdus chilensis]|uniref:FeoC-like transcriptional regulator n=1 Tax=Thiomicrorhabdus chilensis TaxID=63656 RepID=UPI0009FC6E2F|nr:FeoC-like transcriptional regulator [Thiomicrorhabdus chilensis]
MILLQLKQYIRQHHEVSLEDIQNHFDLSEEAVHGLMAPLIRQGHIQMIESPQCSSGRCSTGCTSRGGNERYLWRDKCFISLPIGVQVL